MIVTHIDYIDDGAQGEYGFFGKKVATSNVRGFTLDEVLAEIESMRSILGGHVRPVLVERV